MNRSELRRIPGIGPRMEEDLLDLGIRRIRDLEDRDPAEMYEALRDLRGTYQDRCVLYVFRCAVYFAETPEPQPELLAWWNWKDRVHPNERAEVTSRPNGRPAAAGAA